MQHHNDVIIGAIASQITSLIIVYSTVYSGADQIKHQSSASLAFVWGIHRRPVNSPHKWPVTWKIFPFDDVIIRYGKLIHVLAPCGIGLLPILDDVLDNLCNQWDALADGEYGVDLVDGTITQLPYKVVLYYRIWAEYRHLVRIHLDRMSWERTTLHINTLRVKKNCHRALSVGSCCCFCSAPTQTKKNVAEEVGIRYSIIYKHRL